VDLFKSAEANEKIYNAATQGWSAAPKPKALQRGKRRR